MLVAGAVKQISETLTGMEKNTNGSLKKKKIDDWRHRIWQFIKSAAILLILCLQYLLPSQQSPRWYFQLTFIGFVGIQAPWMIAARATWENQSFTDLQFRTQALGFFIAKYYCDLCQISGSACVYRYSVCVWMCVCESVWRLKGFQREAEQKKIWVHIKSKLTV